MAYIARSYNSAAEATSLLSSVASLAIIVAGLKSRELYEENVRLVLCNQLSLFHKEKTSDIVEEKILNELIIFGVFCIYFKGHVLIFPYLVPRSPTARVRSRYRIKTDHTEFYGFGHD